MIIKKLFQIKKIGRNLGTSEVLLYCCITQVSKSLTYQSVGRPTYLFYYPARACASKGLCDRSWCLYNISKDLRAHARARGYVIGRGVYIISARTCARMREQGVM